MMILLLLFVGFVTFSLGADDTCPPREDIQPCTCSTTSLYGISLRCSLLKDSSELAAAISGSSGSNYYQVTVSNSKLGDLGPDVFRGIRLHSIEFKLAELTTLGQKNQPPFLGLENSLVALTLDECFKKQPMTRFTISHLKKISYLLLRKNLIPAIPNDWFESGPYAMETLYLTGNSVEILGSHVFASLINLKTLWLTGNKISSVSRSMLPSPAQSLQELDLSDNKIQSLPVDVFDEMPSLKKLFLRNNGFTTISEAVFSSVWSQLETVGFGGNSMKCDAKLKWIYKARLPKTFVGLCSSPKSLRGTSLKKIKSKDLK